MKLTMGMTSYQNLTDADVVEMIECFKKTERYNDR